MFKFLIIVILVLGFQTISGQVLLPAEELIRLLDKAEIESQRYSEVFKNLSAEEIKTKNYYREDGSLAETRIIKSLFIVYQSPKNDSIQEFRNILEYNGQAIVTDEEKTADFFEQLAKADTSKEAARRIRQVGLRLDGRIISWGMTLTQDRPFKKSLLPFFAFRALKKEQIGGRDVWVIAYEQTKPTPLIRANPTISEKRQKVGGTEYSTILPSALQPTNPRMKGTLRLDAETGQIWRNDFEIVLHPKKLSQPVVGIEISYEYQMSDFGILTPKKFFIRNYRISGKSDKSLSITKDAESIFEYSGFREFKVEAKDYEIKPN